MIELITQSEVKNIMIKYDIGAKPLSQLLGWEKDTIIHYLKGRKPRTKYSNKLKELNNSNIMCQLLLLNKNNISNVTFRKVETALKHLNKYE